TGGPAPAAPPRPAPRDARVRFLTFTTILFFLLTVVFGMMALSPRSAPIKTTTTRQAAQASVEKEIDAVATRFTTNLIGYNYRTITADLNKMQQDTSDAFPKQFHSALRGDLRAFRKRVIDERASSTGDVKGTTLLSSDGDTAAILVFASQTIRSRRITGDASRYIIIELTLLNTSDGWKVDSARVPSAVGERARS
ncbi:MAG TPA: hypothetical protein VFA34_00250, partial [Actinomycetota bacterium]|nr:hypothetical protein [Actinomycetota bacterium]